MRNYFFVILVVFLCCSAPKDNQPVFPMVITPVFNEYPVKCNIRALEVIDKDQVWFAGSGGTFGYTTNGGEDWTIDSIKDIGSDLEFRSIAITSNAVFLLNVSSPAYLLSSNDQGKNWKIVYQEDHPDIFYDSMKFWDDQNGIAMGDPVDGCLSIIITRDGGNNWQKKDCSDLPPTYPGEAAFAASNSNISIAGDHAWLVTGGIKARVFHSPDLGSTWEVHDTPIVQGGKMTGIFTTDFYDLKLGIIFGGDWEHQSLNIANKAMTRDGGKTWELLADGSYPGYRSSVGYVPGSKGQAVFAVGIPGISYTADGGISWQHIDKQNFYTIRLASNGKVGWLAGKDKIASMQWQ